MGTLSLRARMVRSRSSPWVSGRPRSRMIKSGASAEQLERGLAVRRFEDLIALRGEAHAQQLADRRLVIDHQYADRSGAHAAASNVCRCRGIGRLMVKAAPLRSVRLAAAMVPCMASTKPREMASPRPVPART